MSERKTEIGSDLNDGGGLPTVASSLGQSAPKRNRPRNDSRAALVRSGTALLAERSYAATGIDEVIRHAGLSKGSFYYFFGAKREFGEVVIESYLESVAKRFDAIFNDPERKPMDRLRGVVDECKRGLVEHDFRRGCLIGNLGQELGGGDEQFRTILDAAFRGWERRFAACLAEAVEQLDLPGKTDCEALARFFMMGWEVAILRAKLMQSTGPLDDFAEVFFGTVLPASRLSK